MLMTVIVPLIVWIVGFVMWMIGLQPRTPPRVFPLADIGRILFIIGAFFTIWLLTKQKISF